MAVSTRESSEMNIVLVDPIPYKIGTRVIPNHVTTAIGRQIVERGHKVRIFNFSGYDPLFALNALQNAKQWADAVCFSLYDSGATTSLFLAKELAHPNTLFGGVTALFDRASLPSDLKVYATFEEAFPFLNDAAALCKLGWSSLLDSSIAEGAWENPLYYSNMCAGACTFCCRSDRRHVTYSVEPVELLSRIGFQPEVAAFGASFFDYLHWESVVEACRDRGVRLSDINVRTGHLQRALDNADVFSSIEVGIERLDSAGQRLLGKCFSVQRAEEMFKQLADRDVSVIINLIAGIQGETVTMVRQMVDKVNELNDALGEHVIYMVNMLSPQSTGAIAIPGWWKDIPIGGATNYDLVKMNVYKHDAAVQSALYALLGLVEDADMVS